VHLGLEAGIVDMKRGNLQIGFLHGWASCAEQVGGQLTAIPGAELLADGEDQHVGTVAEEHASSGGIGFTLIKLRPTFPCMGRTAQHSRGSRRWSVRRTGRAVQERRPTMGEDAFQAESTDRTALNLEGIAGQLARLFHPCFARKSLPKQLLGVALLRASVPSKEAVTHTKVGTKSPGVKLCWLLFHLMTLSASSNCVLLLIIVANGATLPLPVGVNCAEAAKEFGQQQIAATLRPLPPH